MLSTWLLMMQFAAQELIATANNELVIPRSSKREKQTHKSKLAVIRSQRLVTRVDLTWFFVVFLTDSQHGDSPGCGPVATTAEPQLGKVQPDWKGGLNYSDDFQSLPWCILMFINSIAALGPMMFFLSFMLHIPYIFLTPKWVQSARLALSPAFHSSVSCENNFQEAVLFITMPQKNNSF